MKIKIALGYISYNYVALHITDIADTVQMIDIVRK